MTGRSTATPRPAISDIAFAPLSRALNGCSQPAPLAPAPHGDDLFRNTATDPACLDGRLCPAVAISDVAASGGPRAAGIDLQRGCARQGGTGNHSRNGQARGPGW